MRTRYELADERLGRAPDDLRAVVLAVLAVLAAGTDRTRPHTDSIHSNILA
ncbi:MULTISPECIES: hypothetical protein [unclassified Streptomyces]|uniref:hypothetical protein n=1 Tax=unclassified Streptomyces TaxID=2593676 RepID=UPI0016532220|nr:hypothetical protein [Streptomyces sp. sk2.1]